MIVIILLTGNIDHDGSYSHCGDKETYRVKGRAPEKRSIRVISIRMVACVMVSAIRVGWPGIRGRIHANRHIIGVVDVDVGGRPVYVSGLAVADVPGVDVGLLAVSAVGIAGSLAGFFLPVCVAGIAGSSTGFLPVTRIEITGSSGGAAASVYGAAVPAATAGLAAAMSPHSLGKH